MLVAEPLVRQIVQHFEKALTTGVKYWAPAASSAVSQQMRLLGSFVRILPHSPATVNIIQRVWVS